MKDIILKIPDEFSDKQIDFIKRSAINQIIAELKTTLTIPQKDIDTVDIKITEVKTAMGIEDEISNEEEGKIEDEII
jgi:hypothetical protein